MPVAGANTKAAMAPACAPMPRSHSRCRLSLNAFMLRRAASPAASTERSPSPNSQYTFRLRCRKTLVQLEDKAKQDEVKAHRELFKNAGSSSAHHASPPKKKTNNKGQVVTPYSPDCGLSPGNPGRDGLRSSRAILCMTPPSKKKKVEQVD